MFFLMPTFLVWLLSLCIMEPNPKRRKRYSICPHCKKELNIKRYKEHKRLYFNKDTKQWIVDDSGAKSSVPEDSSSSDCFSSLDEGDTGDLNNLAMQQEEIKLWHDDVWSGWPYRAFKWRHKIWGCCTASQVTTTRYVYMHHSCIY